MKKTVIRVVSIAFALVLIGCVLFGQTIKNRNTPKVQFVHAKSGSLSWTHALNGEFVWKHTEDIYLNDAQSYELIVTDLPAVVGEYLDSGSVVIKGIVSSQYDRDCVKLEDELRNIAFQLNLLQYEENDSNQNERLIEYKRQYYLSEHTLLESRLNELEMRKSRLETVVNEGGGYFVQYYLTEGDIYGGVSAVYCISLDERPVIQFELPKTAQINQHDSISFACEGDQSYFCTITDVYEQNGINYVEAIPEEQFWIDNTIDEVISRSVHADYTAYSERYQTLIPSNAVHISESEAYIYLAVSEQGYWSEDYIVKRMPVTVLAQSGMYTAVSENILGSENIIISDERMFLNEGAYVMESLP